MSAPSVHPSPRARGVAVVGVAVVLDRVGVVVRPDAAQPWRPGMRLLADPVIVGRHGDQVARWVADAVLAVRLAAIAATSPAGVPRVGVPRPLPGGWFEWHPLITGALLATPGLEVELVGPRWVDRARQRRLIAADTADPSRPDPMGDPQGFARWRDQHPLWSQGYPAELVGPREQSGAGMRGVLRTAWDVAGAAGLRLGERDGEAA